MGVLLVLIGILFVSTILRRTVAPPAEPTPRPPITVPVVVTTRDVPLRTLLKAADVTLVQVPVELVPLNAVGEVSTVIGKITKIPLVAGEMLMRHHLADPTNVTAGDLPFIIGDDQVVMAFPATDLMSQINILKPGDIVDILVSVEVPIVLANQGGEAQAEAVLFTFDALQRVEISAIVVEVTRQAARSGTGGTTARTGLGGAEATPTPTPTPALSEIESRAVLLALAPQDALVVKHLVDAGGVIDIVLRAPTSEQVFQLNPVMSEYLKDRYELVIER